MRPIHIILLTVLTLSGCVFHCDPEPNPDHGCINASFVIAGCCSGTTVFNLDPAFPLGDTITLDSVTYFNAVHIPGKYAGDMRIKLREFVADQDQALRETDCYCIQAEPWEILPVYVITENCNMPQE
jgi:hypothetical protein